MQHLICHYLLVWLHDGTTSWRQFVIWQCTARKRMDPGVGPTKTKIARQRLTDDRSMMALGYDAEKRGSRFTSGRE